MYGKIKGASLDLLSCRNHKLNRITSFCRITCLVSTYTSCKKKANICNQPLLKGSGVEFRAGEKILEPSNSWSLPRIKINENLRSWGWRQALFKKPSRVFWCVGELRPLVQSIKPCFAISVPFMGPHSSLCTQETKKSGASWFCCFLWRKDIIGFFNLPFSMLWRI